MNPANGTTRFTAYRAALFLIGAGVPTTFAFAQGDAPPASFLSLLLPLLVVLGALLAALVWLNRSRGLYRNDGPLKIVQVLPVSPRERVVVLDSGARLMVVGVASGRVSLLSMLDPTGRDVPDDDVIQSVNAMPPSP